VTPARLAGDPTPGYPIWGAKERQAGDHMNIGEILIGRGYVTLEDLSAARERQKYETGRLGENLVAMGLLSEEQLASVLRDTPRSPMNVAETEIPPANLMNLLLKFMHVEGCELVDDLAGRMRIPNNVVQELMDEATQRHFVQSGGAITRFGHGTAIRHILSERGRALALQSLNQSLYVGPVPVSFSAYKAQIVKQPLAHETLSETALRDALRDLVIGEDYVEKLLPAINAGRATLLFGPPGSGKTTIAKRMASLYKDVIYVPFAVDIDGQIVKVFDERLHVRAVSADTAIPGSTKGGVRHGIFDARWVACRRPVTITGGELSLQMLELQYDPDTKFYDAPLHMKALNGVLLIDDFGRQLVSPKVLLNRLIVPMEEGIDYLKTKTGKTFPIPFDGTLIFSTNMSPTELMDHAFLRRIAYKIKFHPPNIAQFREIFEAEAKLSNLALTNEIFEEVVRRLTAGGFSLAHFQPRFICEHVIESCRAFDLPNRMTKDLVIKALSNLYVELEE
jgi:predicted ATPase with chaperone activity